MSEYSQPAHSPSLRTAGIGLRSDHYRAFEDARPSVGFIEVHSENYFGDGGQPLDWLLRFRQDYAVSLHGVGLSLGSAEGLNPAHLAKLKRLVDRVQPARVSDHLCWGRVDGSHLNDLLPLPHTQDALAVVCRNVDQVQTLLGREFLVENVSSYLSFAGDSLGEAQFMAEVARRTGCGLLLDVNNIHVNAVNHGRDALEFLQAIPPAAVREIHLAGFDRLEDGVEPIILIDTHGAPVCDDVWTLYEAALQRIGPVPTLIEWDTDIPPLPVLLAEADRATRLLARHG